MKIIESVFRFVGCLIVCYITSALIDLLFIYVFRVHNDFFGGAIVGGITVGLMVYYYQRRKIRSLLKRGEDL